MLRTSNKAAVPYKVIDGLKIPKTANESYFQEAMSYEPKEHDIFLVSYPKCGTTWVQHIIYLIFNKGVPARSISDILASVPFPEQDGFPRQDELVFAMKYHLPFHFMPFSEKAKYVFVVRNPMDTCVSYYHFLRNLPNYDIESFDVFCEAFLTGDLPYGDYFDVLFSWYEKKSCPNILFIAYEFLKLNHLEAVKKIAIFLGENAIANDECVLKDIVRYSSLDYMKNFLEDGNFMKKYLVIASTEGTRNNLPDISRANFEISSYGKEPKMIRKGCIGDWKKYFSNDQEKRMVKRFGETQIGIELWPDIFKK